MTHLGLDHVAPAEPLLQDGQPQEPGNQDSVEADQPQASPFHLGQSNDEA